MTTRVAWAVAIMLLGCQAGTAYGQDDRRFGLTMGYPTAVGVLWHVTDRVAVRPEIDISRTATKTEGSISGGPSTATESTAHLVQPGVSVLIYLSSRDELRTYVTPRYVYSSSETSQNSETSTHLVSGSFGAQQRLGSRFAVFGELGVEYTRTRTLLPTTQPFSLTSRRSFIELRSSAGVVLYF